jgi:hypothetical protein
MPSSRIVVRGLDEWRAGFDRLTHISEGQEAVWRQATEVMYGRTQEVVHVISGELKASGRFGTTRGRTQIIGEVTYGGTPGCDYAIFETRRGGSHDFLTRGFVAATRTFRSALGHMVGVEVDWWK